MYGGEGCRQRCSETRRASRGAAGLVKSGKTINAKNSIFDQIDEIGRKHESAMAELDSPVIRESAPVAELALAA